QGQLIGIHGRGEVKYEKQPDNSFYVKTGINQGVPILYYIDDKNGTSSIARQNIGSYDDYIGQAFLALRQSGGPQSALRLATEAKKLKESSDIYLVEYEAWSKLNEMDKALVSIDKFITLRPLIPFGFNQRASLYYDLRRYDDAKFDLQKAISLGNDNEFNYANLGNLLMKQGKLDESLIVLNNGYRLHPNSWPINSNLSALHYKNGNIFRALEFAEDSISINPNHFTPYFVASLIYYENHMNPEKSMELLLGVLSLSPKNEAALFKICGFPAFTDSRAISWNACQKIFDEESIDNDKARLIRAVHYLNHDEIESSIMDVNFLLSKDPDNISALALRMSIYMKAGQKKMSCSDYSRLREIDADHDSKVLSIMKSLCKS
ncbi:hypothetical protein OAE83_01570, partial [bacterium]|nr:hypothetical protein [bacterium]